MNSIHSAFLAAAVLISITPGTVSAQPFLHAPFSSGFESPDITTTGVDYAEALIYYQTFPAGRSIGPWRVTQGSVDIVRHKNPTAAGGHQSLDLNGLEAGAIARTVVTKPGAQYQLSFSFSGNPIGGALSAMEVVWDGTVVTTLYYDTAPQTNNYQLNMGWQRQALFLRASHHRSTLEFRSLTAGASGPELDRVALRRVR